MRMRNGTHVIKIAVVTEDLGTKLSGDGNETVAFGRSKMSSFIRRIRDAGGLMRAFRTLLRWIGIFYVCLPFIIN